MSSRTLILLSAMALIAAASLFPGDFESQMTPEEELEAYKTQMAEDWLAAARRGRGRRDDDSLFRMCGTKLLQHIMDMDYCRPDKCDGIVAKRSAGASEEGAAVFKSRARRGVDTKTITALCCTDMCRPSQIRAICCSQQ